MSNNRKKKPYLNFLGIKRYDKMKDLKLLLLVIGMVVFLIGITNCFGEVFANRREGKVIYAKNYHSEQRLMRKIHCLKWMF